MSPDDHAVLLANLQHRVALLHRETAAVCQQSEALKIEIAQSIQSARDTLAASVRVLSEAQTAMAQYPRIV